MPEPKAQLIDPQGPIDVPGLSVTGVTTATGGFAGNVQGAATGLASTTANLSVGIVTATKFVGNTPGNVSGLADDTNINVGIITSTSFTGDLVGNAAGLSTTTANINAGIMSATSFAGNFTGVASGITGTPNIVVGIMTGTLNGDGSSLTGIAATNWITNNVTANSSTTTVNLSLGNVVKFTQSASTTVSFANTGTSNIVTFIRTKDDTSTARTITWPSAIKWNGGSAPTLNTKPYPGDANVITLLTRDEGVTWYGWENISNAGGYGMWAMGDGEYGTIGNNTSGTSSRYSSPTQITGSWIAVSTQYFRTFGIKNDNTLWAWGFGLDGSLGINTPSDTDYSSPVQIPGTNWASISGQSRGIMATKTDGTLWAWGSNVAGGLGQNTGSPSIKFSSPVQIPGTTWDTDDGKINAAYGFQHAIKTDGTLWAWGSGGWGQLGENDDVDRSSPIQIPGTTWYRVSGSSNSALATKTDGTMWTMGYNSPAYANLGLNNTTPASSPTQIPGTTWSIPLCAGDSSAAIKTDGTLWTWGRNQVGELGYNNITRYSSPVQVPGTTWSDVSMWGATTAALKSDGTLWGWGRNWAGGLGQNSRTYYSSPVQIPGTDWSKVSRGNLLTIAFKSS